MLENESPTPDVSGQHRQADPEIKEKPIDAQSPDAIKAEQITEAGIEIQTRSRVYTLTRRSDGFYIKGHPIFCPKFTKITSFGSADKNDNFTPDIILKDGHLKFTIEGETEGPITTSTVFGVKEL